MRILMLAPQPFFQERGTPLAERALLETLGERGHEIDLLTYPEGDDVPLPNVRILRVPAVPGLRGIRPGFSGKKVVYDALLLARCLALVPRRRYDVIHAVEEAAFIALLMKALFGVPFVYDMDSSLAQQMTDRFPGLGRLGWLLEGSEGVAVRGSVGVLTVCTALEERARRHHPETYAACVEDTSLLTPGATTPERLRDTLGVGGALAMYVGNLESYQGIDLLLDAFARASPAVPDAHLAVIGGSDGDVRRYAARADEAGLGGVVHFLGPRPSDLLGAYLAQADVLVSPRVHGDNTPMKVYSYLDAGRALLATRLPTHTQVLDDGIACLVPPEPAAMAEGLVRLLSDPALRGRLAARAQARFRLRYAPDAQRRRLLAFYDGVERRLGPAAS